LKLIYFN